MILDQLKYHADADFAMTVFADGLDASADGRGFGGEHLAARNAIVEAFVQRDALKAALIHLQRELSRHLKFDVKKHYSLMLADAAAGKLLHEMQDEPALDDEPFDTSAL